VTDGAASKRGRVFTQDEVNAILSRAVERQHATSGGLTFEELLDVARQAGIATEAVEAAVSDVTREGAAAAAAKAPPVAPPPDDDAVRIEVAARIWKSRRRFAIHFAAFVMSSVFFAFANWQTRREGDPTIWFPFVVLSWGVVITIHFTMLAYGHFLPDPRAADRVREELQRRENKRLRRDKRDGAVGVRIGPDVRVAGDDDEVSAEARAKTTRRA
jgi:hypothetical protein